MRSRRVLLRLAPYVAAFGLLSAALTWHDGPSPSTNEPTARPKVSVANYKVPAVETPANSGSSKLTIAAMPAKEVTPFTLVGVTWASGMPKTAKIEVRWHGKDGWSDWTGLDQEPVQVDDGPGRPGTEPLWVKWANVIAVRVTNDDAAKPVDVRVGAVTGARASDITLKFASQPNIIMRSQWGARPPTTCSEPRYGPSTQGAVIHHTVGSNSYSQSESAGIVRAIQAYHMDSRNWCDIGYNFLVDRYGQIFEGRSGGIDRPVRGAHAGNDAVNQQTVGVSLMGTFDNVDATAEMKTATVNLVAWRFMIAGIPPKGQVSIGGLTLNRIAGHRDVLSTDCPGKYVYAWLSATGGLRDRVAQILARNPIPPAADGSVYRFWSPRFNNAHFFTIGRAEADQVNANDWNWWYEGVAFRAIPLSSSGGCTSGSPVWRFYSPKFQSHFYTAGAAEADAIKANDPNWNYEGIAYCAFTAPAGGTIPLYRFWSARFGKHFYTTNKAEADGDPNWSLDGIAYHVLP